MKFRKTGMLVALVGMLAGSGCASENTGGEVGAEGESELAQPLQSIEAGLEKVEFFEANGGILMSFSKPNALPRFAIDVLEESAGQELTPLEVFQSLAPAGATPNARLVEDHAARARVLQRADLSVLRVAFEPQLTLEKAWTPAQCEQSLIPNTIVQIRKDYLSANIQICTANRPQIPQGSCNDWIQTTRHRAGVCNNSSTGAMTGSASIISKGNSTWATTTTAVAANHSQLWIGTPQLNYELTKHKQSKMMLTAGWQPAGSTYHARLADF